MNIPPKYEDVVARLEAALGREAALREELTKFKAGCVDLSSQVRELEHKMDYYKGEGLRADALQQRLTVAELLLSQVEGACDLAMSAIGDDGRGANFVKIIQAIKDKSALKPAAEGELS